MPEQNTIAIIGGSGVYELPGIQVVEESVAETPFGKPSSPITIAEVNATKLLFLARHGKNHSILPHEINYRANIYALKELGARWCLSVSAAGSLKEEIAPGDLVIPSQGIDFTKSRSCTFFGDGVAAHVSLANPYCETFRENIIEVASKHSADKSYTLHRQGCYICIEGPQLSSRAESDLFRKSFGADVIGMTMYPEAKLAREAGLAYATIAMISDYDCWRQNTEDASIATILATLQKTSSYIPEILTGVISTMQGKSPSKHILESGVNSLMQDPNELHDNLKKRLAAILYY